MVISPIRISSGDEQKIRNILGSKPPVASPIVPIAQHILLNNPEESNKRIRTDDTPEEGPVKKRCQNKNFTSVEIQPLKAETMENDPPFLDEAFHKQLEEIDEQLDDCLEYALETSDYASNALEKVKVLIPNLHHKQFPALDKLKGKLISTCNEITAYKDAAIECSDKNVKLLKIIIECIELNLLDYATLSQENIKDLFFPWSLDPKYATTRLSLLSKQNFLIALEKFPDAAFYSSIPDCHLSSIDYASLSKEQVNFLLFHRESRLNKLTCEQVKCIVPRIPIAILKATDFIHEPSIRNCLSIRQLIRRVNSISTVFLMIEYHPEWHLKNPVFLEDFELERKEYWGNEDSLDSVEKWDHACKLLGISRDANASEIKKGFANFSLQFHPDRIISQGKREGESDKQFNERIAQIQEEFKPYLAAYNYLQKFIRHT